MESTEALHRSTMANAIQVTRSFDRPGASRSAGCWSHETNTRKQQRPNYSRSSTSRGERPPFSEFDNNHNYTTFFPFDPVFHEPYVPTKPYRRDSRKLSTAFGLAWCSSSCTGRRHQSPSTAGARGGGGGGDIAQRVP